MTDDRATYTYLCIGCPLGCRLEVDEDGAGEVVEIRGAGCRKGDRYAAQEHTDPRRVLTTTVAIEGARWPRLPVRTQEPIPKGSVLAAARELATVSVAAPIGIGDVIADDVAGSGVTVVATRDMPADRPM